MSTLLPGDFPKVVLSAPDTARAEIYLHGGHITSWRTPDGRERLFLSEKSEFGPHAAIRGGVPVVFPQFAGLGPLPKHGFARTMSWSYIGDQTNDNRTVTAHFRLDDTPTTRAIWARQFRLDLKVTVGGPQLRIALQVTNCDAQSFEFAAALHTYFRVGEIERVTVEGLGGLAYREFGSDAVQPDGVLSIVGEVDRIYRDVPGPVRLYDDDQTLEVVAEGFPDIVVWNPGLERGATLADLEPEGYRHMLCIEAAAIGEPVALEPDESWRGVQQIMVVG
ncbi:MAG: D-hexose-6-phosphate mutarotase [Chloroflexi bacterium]|jgi:glucose-6-phosphate 1-epimerase|nr:D-hexose-6-phosphate mutarotase [Chloroflexota bacterium]